ncbi:hypothetical protein ACIRQH_34815 [Streptomyces sp. NPDC102279]|uniref:hypothetical protein n=1 Tax=Streptomyces sp. NPDC102279 TaxID=3366153 RepID=UPI0038190277
MTTDRALALAKARQQIGNDNGAFTWEQLSPIEQEMAVSLADTWLQAAVAAGIAPAADRPTPKHDAIWVDEEGFIYGEYQTSPPTPLADAAILRLVWDHDVCSSKREMEDNGATFQLIGWSQ